MLQKVLKPCPEDLFHAAKVLYRFKDLTSTVFNFRIIKFFISYNLDFLTVGFPLVGFPQGVHEGRPPLVRPP